MLLRATAVVFRSNLKIIKLKRENLKTEDNIKEVEVATEKLKNFLNNVVL